MELLQLRYFFESAKTGSFAKTAKKYMVPLTSVSSSIRRLEEELGCKLFERTSNRVFLNENGRKLQQSLCAAFAEIDGALEQITSKEDTNREIKVLVRGMRRKITDLVLGFKEMVPDCTFKISFNFNERNFEEYDIVIDEESKSYAEYQKFEFYSTKLRIRCAKDNPLLGKTITTKQLCNASFISMGEESNMHKLLMDMCSRAGFAPKISVLCNDLECYEKLIAGGIGIAIGKETSQTPGICFLDVSDFDERYTLYCYYKPSSYYGIVKEFVDFLKSPTDGCSQL